MEMTESALIAPRHRESFERDGYVVVPGMLEESRVAGLAAEVERITSVEEPTAGAFYWESSATDPGARLLRRVEQVTALSPLIRDLFQTTILEGAGALLGEPAIFFKDKLNMKLPGGAGFRPHIDGHFRWKDRDGNERRGWMEYASYFMSVLVSLDPARRENGCMQVARLEDTFQVVGRDFDTILSRVDGRGPEIRPEHAARIELRHLETEPGDVIYFDWRIVHASDANSSSIPRRILYGTYSRAAEGDHLEAYYRDKRDSAEPTVRKALG